MLHHIHTSQFLPISKQEAWDFLSSPANLKEITPAYMGFNILSGYEPGQKMYAGMIIEYAVKPLWNIPLHWVTEITRVEDLTYFVDEQRFGPYRFWHHQHWIQEVPGGVQMIDKVHYKLPLGFIGKWLNRWMVQRQLRQIFTYREEVLRKKFGTMPVVNHDLK